LTAIYDLFTLKIYTYVIKGKQMITLVNKCKQSAKAFNFVAK